jgi:hypothetical protein
MALAAARRAWGGSSGGIGLGRPVDGLSGLVDRLFLFFFFFYLFTEVGKLPSPLRPD